LGIRRAETQPRGVLILPSYRIIAGLAEITDRYAGFILDLWGVVHDGKRPYPGSLAAMAAIRRQGKPLLLLSNAPRRAAAVQTFLDTIGVPRDAYDGTLTSGDLVHEALRSGAISGPGAGCFRIGPGRNHGLTEGLDLRLVDDITAADLLLVTGLLDDETESAADYRAMLEAALARRLPLVCANPDLSVMRGPREVPCAGAIAALYEAMGGPVHWYGKPDASAYRASLVRLGLPAESLLAVGDSFRTDIQGASRFGIDSLFVAGGLHASHWQLAHGTMPSAAQLTGEIDRWGLAPTYVTALLTWR
jgi:HAD superfamily hydrolase (TIGR01459 family)